MDPLIERQIALQQIVGRDHHIVIRGSSKLFLTLRRAAGDQKHPQGRRKFHKFTLPVIDQRRRTYDQGYGRFRRLFRGVRLPFGVLLRITFSRSAAFYFPCLIVDHADDLHGLSQSHIVRQDPAEAEEIQRPKPAKTDLLVAPQHTCEGLRHLKIAVLHRFHPAHDRFKMRISLQPDIMPLPVQAVQIESAVLGHPKNDPRRVILPVLSILRGGIIHHARHRQKAVIRKRQKLPAFQPVIWLFLTVRLQDLSQLRAA